MTRREASRHLRRPPSAAIGHDVSPAHHSQVAKGRSLAKLEVKIAVLNRWAERGVPWRTDAGGACVFDVNGDRVLEFFPTSQNQVRRWTEADNGAGLRATLDELLAEGRITAEQRRSFASYKADIFSDRTRAATEKALFRRLQESLVAALADVARQAAQQLETHNKASIIVELTERVARTERMLRDTATHYLKAVVERNEAVRRAAKTERRRQSLAREVAEKDAQIRSCEARIGELTRALSKVAPMKEVRDDDREDDAD